MMDIVNREREDELELAAAASDAAAVVIDAEGVDHEAAPEQEGAAADDGERHRRQRDLRVHCAGRRCIHISTSPLGPPLQLCHARFYFYTVTQLVEFEYSICTSVW